MHKLSALLVVVAAVAALDRVAAQDAAAASPAPATAPAAVPPVPEGYDPELWQRAVKLHRAALVVDTHSDTTTEMLDNGVDMLVRNATGHMDLPRIFEGGLDVQFYSIYVSAAYYGAEDLSSAEALQASRPNASARRALQMMDAYWLAVERSKGRMAACFSVSDIRNAVAKGQHAALMGIEGGHAIEGDLRLLRMFYRAGIRYMTLTHSNHNEYADSSGEAEPKWGGLNELGVKVVEEMNRLGMMVDVSHVSDDTFYDALKVTRAPVILSHSSCRALCGHLRNITDDMLRALAKNGGVIMINFNCGFLDDKYSRLGSAYYQQTRIHRREIERKWPAGHPDREKALAALRERFPPPEPPDVSVLIDHIVHAIQVAGVDHVGLGSDFDGVPCVPKGMDDVTHLPRITYWLLQRGIPEEGVKKVLGQNLMRVFEAVEKAAAPVR